MTERPTRLLAPKAIWAVSAWPVWSATASIFSSEVNWADWARNCEESVGFIGSWYFSWATISCRNMSLFTVGRRGAGGAGAAGGPGGRVAAGVPKYDVPTPSVEETLMWLPFRS